MNRHQTQHTADQKSYVAFLKKNGGEPEFMGSTKEQKDKFNALHKKWIAKWEKWSKS